MNRAEKRELEQGKVAGIYGELSGQEIQELLESRARRAALSFGLELLEQEVEGFCGARYGRIGEYYRYGTERSSIVIGGARYKIERPRIRGSEGEVYPPMLKKLREQELLDKEIKDRMLLGVSSRNYEKVIEGYSDKLGISRSSVSRAFGRASKKELGLINESDLGAYRFVGIMIDGLEIAGRTVIAAVGITSELEKIPLGLVEGSTENAEIVTDLLASLKPRHFTLYCKRLLCVLDGSKALKKAVCAVFGASAVIQRCWLHKLRNIESYLPNVHHKTLLWRMKKVMGLKSRLDAKREMSSLRTWLEEISYDAAKSLDEAGDDLLRLHELRVTGQLRKSLSCTNIIEPMFSVVRRKLHNVTNWKQKKSIQTLRWVAAAIADHQKNGIRKLRGVNQSKALFDGLDITLEHQVVSA